MNILDSISTFFLNLTIKEFSDLLIGIGTILIGLLGYNLAKKEYKPLIKARLLNTFYGQPGSRYLDQHVLSINAFNYGKRSIKIKNVVFSYSKLPFSKRVEGHDLYILDSDFSFSDKLPHVLKDGDSLQLIYPHDIFMTYKIGDEQIKSNKYFLDLYRILFFKIYLITSIEYRVKVKISLKMRLQIMGLK